MPPRSREFQIVVAEPVSNEATIAKLVEGAGLLPEEARVVCEVALDWSKRVADDKEPTGELVEDIIATLSMFEERVPGFPDWDAMRFSLAEALLVKEEYKPAGELLADARNLRSMLNRTVKVFADGVSQGWINPAKIQDVTGAVQERLIQQGRGFEFWQESRAALIRQGRVTQDFLEVSEAKLREIKGDDFDIIDDWARLEISYAPNGPWVFVTEGLRDDTQWTHIDMATRQHICYTFCSDIHNMLAKDKIAGKEVASLKCLLSDLEQTTTPQLADSLRFAASMSFYNHEFANIGKGIAKSMDDPNMMASVCIGLLLTQKDNDALELTRDLPDYKIMATVFCIGEWQDKNGVNALLEDITVVTQRTRQKYDPDFRIGLAEGLLAFYRDERERYERRGDDVQEIDETITLLAKRLDLLQRQKTSGFIKPPAKARKR